MKKEKPSPGIFWHSVYYNQAEAGEIFIETEAGDILKDRFYNYIGNGVAKGKFLVLAQKPENSLGLLPHRIVVFNDLQDWLDFIHKTDGGLRMEPIKKESRGFTDDIPGCLVVIVDRGRTKATIEYCKRTARKNLIFGPYNGIFEPKNMPLREIVTGGDN